MKSVAAVFTAALFLAMSAGAFAQQKLEYKATGPTPILYRAHTDSQTLESMMGQNAMVSVKTDQQLRVKSHQEGSVLVYEITIDSSISETILPSGDTTRNASSPAVGQTEETRMRPDGRKISSMWLDSTFAKTQTARLKDISDLFFKLPDKEVSTGSTWNDSRVDTVVRGDGQGDIFVTTNSNYKVTGEKVSEGVPCMKIEYTGTVRIKGTTSYQGIDFSIGGTGSLFGTALFDYTNGRIARVTGSAEQSLNLVSSGQRKVTIPMTQKTTYELFLVK